jgi:hypothetical protein
LINAGSPPGTITIFLYVIHKKHDSLLSVVVVPGLNRPHEICIGRAAAQPAGVSVADSSVFGSVAAKGKKSFNKQ